MEAEIQEKIIGLTAKQFRKSPDEINLTDRFREDLGADSLDLTELIMGLEEEFDMIIPDDLTVETVSEAIELIEKMKS